MSKRAQREERNEALVYQAFRKYNNEWLTNEDVSRLAGVSYLHIAQYTESLAECGVLEKLDPNEIDDPQYCWSEIAARCFDNREYIEKVHCLARSAREA